MVRLHGGAVAAEELREPALRREPHAVVAEHARRLAVRLRADHLGKVLDDVAAARHVQHLRAAAHGEDGHVPLQRRRQQRELRAVTVRHGAARLGVRLSPVRLRVEIVAAREDDAVERVERLLHPVLDGGHEQRAPARALDDVDVRERDDRRRDRPAAP